MDSSKPDTTDKLSPVWKDTVLLVAISIIILLLSSPILLWMPIYEACYVKLPRWRMHVKEQFLDEKIHLRIMYRDMLREELDWTELGKLPLTRGHTFLQRRNGRPLTGTSTGTGAGTGTGTGIKTRIGIETGATPPPSQPRAPAERPLPLGEPRTERYSSTSVLIQIGQLS